MSSATNGLKGIIGLIALAYIAFIVTRGVSLFLHGGLNEEIAFSYGIRILAYGGLSFACFALSAYRFSSTPLYYLMATLLMALIGWQGYLKSVELSRDASLVAVDQPAPAPVQAPAKPAPIAKPTPVAASMVVVTPPPKAPVDLSWAKDGLSGPEVITPATSQFINPDHVHQVQQPIPTPTMAASSETTNNATP